MPTSSVKLSLMDGQLFGNGHEVLQLLSQRGLSACARPAPGFLYLPPAPEPDDVRAFYGLMKHYAFRLFLRDVIRFQEDLSLSALTHFVDEHTARVYVAALERLGMLVRDGERMALPCGPVENFGATLEWFVARVLALEFAIPAVFGLRLVGTGYGGDYDVVGAMSGQLVYIETKSAPPKHIDDREVEVFLERLWALKPDLAVFLVDTNLRMLDRVVAMFGRAGVPCERLESEIFHTGHQVFVSNSKHELVANLRVCLRAYHAARFRWPGRARGRKM